MRVRSPTNIETGNKIHSWGLNVIRLQDHRDVPYSKTRVGSKTLSSAHQNGAIVAKNQQKSRPSVSTELDKIKHTVIRSQVDRMSEIRELCTFGSAGKEIRYERERR